jgi:hypothetical protein
VRLWAAHEAYLCFFEEVVRQRLLGPSSHHWPGQHWLLLLSSSSRLLLLLLLLLQLLLCWYQEVVNFIW